MNVKPLLNRLSLALLLTVLLGACGWQLQGMRRVPEHLLPLYLDLQDEHSLFARALTTRLRTAGVSLTTERTQAHAVLRISRDVNGHHVSSVSALNEPQQFEVFYNIDYQLDRLNQVQPDRGDVNREVDVGSNNLLPSQAVAVARTMSYDKTLALAKQREEQALQQTLAEEIVDQIVLRLSLVPPQRARVE